MLFENVEKIANSVLYDGDPPRSDRGPAAKNRPCFNFGVLYPPEFSEGSEASEMRTECLLAGNRLAAWHTKVRFLQWIGDVGRECEVDITCALRSLARAPLRRSFQFEPCAEGEIDLSVSPLTDGLFRISLAIRNRSDFTGASRDRALAASLICVHSILRAEGGEFVSLLDPPEHIRRAAQACRNVGNWPVLAGDPNPRDARYASILFASPVRLCDYPRTAPESSRDPFETGEVFTR